MKKCDTCKADIVENDGIFVTNNFTGEEFDFCSIVCLRQRIK